MLESPEQTQDFGPEPTSAPCASAPSAALAASPAHADPGPALTDGAEIENAYRLHRRFDRMGRLLGDRAMERLFSSHVMVVGVGGVGSFAAESLARSGIGRLTLVDFDRVCVTNTNRQLQAMKGTVGKAKVHVLAERLRLINPQAEVRPVLRFYDASTAAAILALGPDFVVDAIDNVTAKCHLLSTCKRLALPVVCATGAAGRLDPTAVAIGDLADTRIDPLAQEVRKILRQKYAFPAAGPFGIQAVYSTEHPRAPVELHYDEGAGFHCVCPGGKNEFHSCDERRLIYGTASFVTGNFGLCCASVVVRALTSSPG